MNAAFLLVTSAWLAGQAPAVEAPKTIAPAPAPAITAHAAPIAQGCGGGCGSCETSCCDSCSKPSLMDRLRARFKKNDCCDSCNTCSSCSTCTTVKYTSCDSCCEKEGFFSRLRNKFRKSDCCDSCNTCGTGCSSCGTTGVIGAPGVLTPAPAVAPQSAEPIQAPKKEMPMPKGSASILVPQPVGPAATSLAIENN